MTSAVVIRKALIAVFLVPILAAVFVGAVTAAFSLPNEPIAENILTRPELITEKRADNGRVIDADTECIGLSVGLYVSADAPATALKRAVNAESLFGCDGFMIWLNTREEIAHRDYFRYWHGYTLLTRTFLSFLPYNDLRGHLFNACILLTGVLVWRLGRDFGALFGVAFLAPFLVINAFGFWVVATKAVTWFLIIGGSLFFSRRKSAAPPLVAFFLLGALTAFFDYFTTPVLVFVYPALVYFIYSKDGAELRQPWLQLIAVGGFFLFGYAGLWAAKLAIASATLDAPVWRDAADAAMYRLRGPSEHVESFIPGAAIYENFQALKLFWGIVALVLFVLAPFATTESRQRIAVLWREGRIFIVLAALPVLWLEIASNHAQYHAAFSQLNLAPAFFMAGLVLTGASTLLTGRDVGRSAPG